MNTVFAIVGLAALTLTGCAGHTHALAPASGNPSVTVGTFSHEGREAPAMLLEVGGRRFTAQGFAIRRDTNRSVSQQHDSRSRRHSGIAAGSDSEHYDYSANPELRAADGAVLRCTLTWPARQAPAGYCERDEGTRIAVRFE
ncbi:MAG: hypothetical protein FAZ92_03316 [Accumulibacter sp.]|jgi:hypothetical protein|uniref:Lipoprotein n=1 Tax=Candidatus Accumulibacter contiguus TaxID=2954381 RepID=A0ABX1TEA2_9PROT|nr:MULTISPECIES: hypothetical protein [Candidatus Accumulibacter]NMQ08017.1 hypothetical protein [Candidatus Accumulibacter contiguus]TLD44414.1 MAG: hypothetical protein FAZ92_03316 [Accumulibacter sp.]